MTDDGGEYGSPARVEPRVRAVDASMGLLNDVVSKALDPAYTEAARRPVTHRSARSRVMRSMVHMVVAVVLGIVTVVAISELRAPQFEGSSPRALLEREITQRSVQGDELAATVEELSAEISGLQNQMLASDRPQLLEQIRNLELLSGALAVSGPGIVIELDDGESVDPSNDASRVQDFDLQVVTNGLWAAGAEAIAINGQRLTPLSAIRGAGQAILVDLVPLIAPYRIEIIGDPDALQTTFARSSAANHLAFLSGTYGIDVTTTTQDDLELPGAGNAVLHHARVLEDVASSSAPEEEGPS